MGANRGEALEMHPTVKPTALVADAIRDCSKRGDIVLDAFGGSGTALIAAETCGRSARMAFGDRRIPQPPRGVTNCAGVTSSC